MSWIQTAYLIAEIIAIPLTGFLTRTLTMRWLFVVAVSVFTLASSAAPLSGSFTSLDRAGACCRDFAGGTLIPAVFSAVFLLFPFRLQPIATTIAGVVAVLAPTVGPGGRRLDHRDLFLALAVPDQCRCPGSSRPSPRPSRCPASGPTFDQARHLDALSLALMARSPGGARDRHQGGAAARLDLAAGGRPAGLSLVAGAGLRAAHASLALAAGRSADLSRP